MDISKLQADIAAAIDHEKRTGTLARLVQTALKKREPAISDAHLHTKTEHVVGVVRGFVESMVGSIEVTLAAAQRAGIAAELTPIFDTALAYVNESFDFIPDEFGLCGLVDDAYLVHGLMQEISQRHGSMTGQPLLPARYFEQIQGIRRMIGEPTATRLDVAVVAFARRPNIRETIDQISKRFSTGGVSMDLPINFAFPAAGALDDLPNLELGALGG